MTTNMTALEAALRVLQDEGKPLHYREITKRILAGKLWQCSGKTPEATINAQLAVNIKQNVQAPAIQQVRGSLGAHEQGLIISTSDFSKGAKQEAERPDATPVALMNGEQLVALLVENDIGARRTPLQLIQLGEDEDSGEREILE